MLALLTATIAVAAIAPLWASRAIGLGPKLVATALALAVAAVALGHDDSRPPPATTRPLEIPGDGYAGSRTCRACHPDQHASWHESFHRTMTQVADRTALAARFERLDLDWFGAPVVLEWRGDRLWTRFQRRGLTPAAIERPIEQLTGSHHLQVLWYSTGDGRELAPVPLCYHIEEGIWLPLTAVFVLPPEVRDPPEPGAWNQSCQGCHATNSRPRVDRDRTDTQVTEFGIACEACHGPGQKHVDANRNPLMRWLHRRAGDGEAIVDPAALPPARSAQVCGQCHSVSVVRHHLADDWREHGSPFRPGDDLDVTHLVVDEHDGDTPEVHRELRHNPHFFASSFWSDGEVRLSGREYNGLRRSPCFTHGDPRRQPDCTSCHQMHRAADADATTWKRGQLAPASAGNRGCTQCHGELDDPAALAAHTHHGADSSGSSCYNCHMPHTSFALMKASRSHTVSSPSVATELATRRPNACNLCHLDRTLQWTSEQLQANWGIEPVPLPDDARDVATGARWMLTGDAGLRALVAWSCGWSPAQRAAGTDWMAPYLARLLDDPYYVVRFGAARSLRSLPDAPTAALGGYDFLGPVPAARAVAERITDAWQQRFAGPARPALRLGDRGLQNDAFAELYARRDDRPVYLAE